MPEPCEDVLVVDSRELVRQGITRVLELAGIDPAQVWHAASAGDARAMVAHATPAVVLVAVALPDGDGIQLCRDIGTIRPGTPTILLTTRDDPRTVLAAGMAGVVAVVSTAEPVGRLRTAVVAALAGDRLLDETTMQDVVEHLSTTVDPDPHLHRLTTQERRVFELVGLGLTNREIGGRLSLSEKTVKNYVSHILGKLHLERRAQAASLAARLAARRTQVA